MSIRLSEKGLAFEPHEERSEPFIGNCAPTTFALNGRADSILCRLAVVA